MKIGIMSMQRIINYGSFLQAYGLKKIIESCGDYEVQFVDYKAEPSLVSEKQDKKKNRINRIFLGFKVLFFPSYRKKRNIEIRQNQAFSSFYKVFDEKWIPKFLDVGKETNYLPNLDVLVIGSDEVFNCTQRGKDVGYSLQLFGKDNKANKLISYAASFGSTTYEKLSYYGKLNEIGNYLSKFDSISVRDKNSYQIVKKLTNIVPKNNVDPVLVYDFNNEVTKQIDMTNYVVVYAYSGRINEDEAKAIQEFAHRHGKKTLSIGVMQSFTDEYVMVNPFDMLAYIKKADYVVTDTFHGTVFSIKYQIPFAVIIRESNKQKLTDLLEKFDLTTRIVDNTEKINSVLLSDFDKESIRSKIKEYHEEAIDYLKNNLKV